MIKEMRENLNVCVRTCIRWGSMKRAPPLAPPVLVKTHSKVQPRDIIQRHRDGVYNDMIKNNLFIKMGGHAASLNTCFLPI
ncbi:hypothetical protein [Aeromonas allosaccharophila]|uniref:Uncharacterized protein n=1 Tax=Aeromonas allosaccharophila TaxID=656 RepID=A0A7T2UNZ3_9GAMM|nr:hypothetical protein [Aeromonas allosaccharophila]QPR56017.1 hypothetical protein I6G90_06235 [Aeromonas allosaccharophila]